MVTKKQPENLDVLATLDKARKAVDDAQKQAMIESVMASFDGDPKKLAAAVVETGLELEKAKTAPQFETYMELEEDSRRKTQSQQFGTMVFGVATANPDGTIKKHKIVGITGHYNFSQVKDGQPEVIFLQENENRRAYQTGLHAGKGDWEALARMPKPYGCGKDKPEQADIDRVVSYSNSLGRDTRFATERLVTIFDESMTEKLGCRVAGTRPVRQ